MWTIAGGILIALAVLALLMIVIAFAYPIIWCSLYMVRELFRGLFLKNRPVLRSAGKRL